MSWSIKINGNDYPPFKRTFVVTTLKKTRTNANGKTIGQKIGRDRLDFGSIVWGYLRADVWSEILKEFEDGYADVLYPDMVNNDWTTREMHVGERTAIPFSTDRNTGLPTAYVNCKMSLIDVGDEIFFD